MKSLVIVESPTKAKTIGRFLGEDFDIKYSMGHIIDLPKSKLGVDVDNNFTPQYEVIDNKKKIISEFKSAAKSADEIILATDPDREGEAIASNIRDILSSNAKIKPACRQAGNQRSKFRRVVFHEITEGAIKDAFNHPRDIDVNLVDAQTARRVLDRLVGYQLSPLLWQKVRRGLSAGRVQSVTLRLIVEREREIEKFAKSEYFTISARLAGQASDPVQFELIEVKGEKIEKQGKFELYDGEYKISKTTIDTERKAEEIVRDMQGQRYVVADVNEREMKRSPYAPYTTSTLQQDGARRYGFSGKRTMSLAQKLYEEGFITYHRTDSVTLSRSAVAQIREYVKRDFGEKYVSPAPRIYTAKQKSAQEAHEAVRPTKIDSLVSGQHKQVLDELGHDYGRLYELIWRRAVASQMADAVTKATTVYADSTDVILSEKKDLTKNGKDSSPDSHRPQNDNVAKYRLKANGSVLVFDGFLKVNAQALQDTKLPEFTEGEELEEKGVSPEKHETPPPPRYNDASLIQALEEEGIGRPSTYAAIISTIVDRGYVERVDKKFVPSAVGLAVNDFLVANFSDIDDIPFTAQMEDGLDDVADGKTNWVAMMREFYVPFSKKLVDVKGAARVKIQVEETNETCPECGAKLVIRTGRFGKFMSCSAFPECKFTKPIVEETSLVCPKDGAKIIIKKTRKGRRFYGCSSYPKCDFAAWKLEDIKKGAASQSE